MHLLKRGDVWVAVMYVLLSVVVGISAIALAYRLTP
jgi:fluoride ion exporter CrcB/FEX